MLYARDAFIKKHTNMLRDTHKQLSVEIHKVSETDISKKQEYVEQLKLKAKNFFGLQEKLDPSPKDTIGLQQILSILITKFSESIKTTKEGVSPTSYLDADRYDALVPRELQSTISHESGERRTLPTVEGNKVVPSLFGLYEHLWDKDLRAYVKSKDKKSFDVLAKIPGEGKTSRLLAMATTVHTVLLTITLPATFNSALFKDPSFEMMQTRMDKYDHFGLIQHARSEVDKMILIRLLHLLACVIVTDLSPMEFILMQLNGANKLIADMAEHMYSVLANCSSTCIRSLIEDAVKQLNQKCKRVGFCVDELSAVAHVPARL